jgi:hypothetical protein
MRGSAVVIGGLCVVAALAWWLRSAVESDEPASVAPPAALAPVPDTPPTDRTARVPQSPPPAVAVALSPPLPRPALHGHDMVDPCEPVGDPAIPAEYTTITANDITVAWSPETPAITGPTDISLRATSVAYLVSGILDEAAAFTGTFRRGSLAVVVYPAGDFVKRTGVPAWAGGAYDGAVRVPAIPNSDLGVSISALRHEVMHAQMHAAVGCIPAWFNEGAAMYFAGGVPVLEWLSLLRAHDVLDFTGLQGSGFTEMPADRARRMYAFSLAMVLFAIEHLPGDGIQPLVRAAQTAGRSSPRAALELWEKLFPGADNRVVQDLLAHKLLGVATGSALDDKLRGGVCCDGMRSPGQTACRTAAARPGSTTWLDVTGPHDMRCFTVPDSR